jgi:hypothetical protein
MLAYPVVSLALLYNKAKIVPEANAMGTSTISRIVKDLHYANVYIRQKFNTLDGSLTNEWGFYTSGRTRPILINMLRNLIATGELQLYDMDTIQEFLNFVFIMKNGKIRMEASPGMHDDCVLSSGLGIVDIESEDTLINKNRSGVPYGSIEYYAQKMDRASNSSIKNYGSVIGI